MGNGGLQGWHADPFQLHEERYFSAGQPTALVRDGGTESRDEPPAGDREPVVATAPATPFMATAAAAPGPSETGGPEPGFMPAGPHGGARDARQYGGAAIGPRRRSRPGAVAGVTLLVAAAVVGVLVLTNRPGTGPALSPAAFVRQSAQRTLAQQTASMTLSMSLQFAGQSATLNGTGELNFSTGAMALDIKGGPAGQQLDMKEILVDGTLYMAFSVDGQPAPGFGGNTWTELKTPDSGPGVWDNGNPYTMLPQIERQGSTLRPLGTKVIRGVTCTGYAVTPPADEGSPVTITVWADSKQLVREMTASVQMDGVGSSAQVTMDFFGFGAPVHITAPPPDITYTA